MSAHCFRLREIKMFCLVDKINTKTSIFLKSNEVKVVNSSNGMLNLSSSFFLYSFDEKNIHNLYI